MNRVITFITVVLTLIIPSRDLYANNLKIGAPSVSASSISFTVQWENSWRVSGGPGNWDAVWLFVKYQKPSEGNTWHHMNLSTSAAAHSSGGLLEVVPVTDGKGVYVRRNANGFGNISSTTVNISMSVADAGYNYQVFGVEMVYVPTGDFDVGDGLVGSAGHNFRDPSGNPILINSNVQNSTGLPASAFHSDLVNNRTAIDLPITFPMGRNSFYCMKYEITQEQYMAFLNTLTFEQQVNRTAVDPRSAAGTQALSGVDANRNGIKIQTPGVRNSKPAVYMCDLNGNGVPNENNDGQVIACNWLKWDDLLAYLDWAALRPMSEMEYEKVCRGPLTPVANELAWGTTKLIRIKSTSANMEYAGTPDEVYKVVGPGLAAVADGTYDSSYGPMRVGFAATSLTSREEAGAAYYGAMDLAGNVGEMVVSVFKPTNGSLEAAAFKGIPGDGVLSDIGNANTVSWPSYLVSNMKGGHWRNYSYPTISERTWIMSAFLSRFTYSGGRGVR